MKNKKLSRRILSIALLIALLATSYPVATAVEDAAPFEDAIADILTEGDLPLEKLADKELPDEELPEIIDPETARENKNVHRLYKQETDFNSVLFQNSDGSKTMYYFEDAVKYIDYDGNIKDKSNKLYRDKYGLSNADNDIRTYFPDELSETSGVVLNAGNVAIEMVPLPLSSAETSDVLFEEAAIEDTTKKIISTAEQKEDNYVYYNGSFGKGSAIRYTPTYTGVKEDIILESDIGLYDFNFLVSAKGLSAVSDGRRVEFYDDAGNVVAEFAEIVIYDSGEENNITFDSSVSIKETEIPGEYVYTIHAAKDFLQNEETVYPVFIDPVISLPISTTGSGTSKTIIDNPIYSGLPNSCAGSNVYNVVGYAGVAGTGYGVGRTLMKFPGLINNTTFRSISDQQVRSLYLNLYEASGKSTSTTIYANLYTGAAWNETSTTYRNVTWNGYGTQLSSKNFSGGGNTLVQFDLTLAALTWKNNSTIADKGIMLRNSNESSDAYRRDFRSTENSSNKPVIIFSFDTSIPVTSVTVLPASATVTVNSSLTLTASVIPSNATNRNIIWTSSNNQIATVSTTGVVSGKKSGTATIKATAADGSGKFAQCTLTVSNLVISNVKVYQSPRLPGKNADGTTADDMVMANKTKTQLYAMSIVLGDQANVYHQSALPPAYPAGPQILKDHAKQLATLFAAGNSSMRTVANGMFDHFFSGTGTDYRNSTLTNTAVAHSSTQTFINSTKQHIVNYLRANSGNPFGALANTSLKNSLNGVARPVYNTSSDKTNGLTICVNDTWGNYIEIKNYTFNGTSFSGTLRYTIYDHFGLNDTDVTGAYGGLSWIFGYTAQFSAWFVLQHYTECNRQYKPFITYIETEVSFSGTI